MINLWIVLAENQLILMAASSIMPQETAFGVASFLWVVLCFL
jgi:hypothetical protein